MKDKYKTLKDIFKKYVLCMNYKKIIPRDLDEQLINYTIYNCFKI